MSITTFQITADQIARTKKYIDEILPRAGMTGNVAGKVSDYAVLHAGVADWYAVTPERMDDVLDFFDSKEPTQLVEYIEHVIAPKAVEVPRESSKLAPSEPKAAAEASGSMAQDAERTPQADLESRYAEYSAYLKAIFRPGDVLCFVCIEHNINKDKDVERRGLRQFFVTLEEALTWGRFDDLVVLNNTPSAIEGNSMPSIYVAMNTYPSELINSPILGGRIQKGRTQENVVAVRALQSDADVNGKSITELIDKSDRLQPSPIRVESSTGKFQDIWPVDGVSKDEASPLMDAIAHQFGMDSSVAETARVMRVPGFYNRKHKYNPHPLAKLIRNTGVRRNRDAFKFDLSATQKPIGDSGNNPKFDLRQPFIHGRLDDQICSFIGHYIAADNIKNPDTLYDLLEKRIDENGCYEPLTTEQGVDLYTPDLNTSFPINMKRVRDLCELKTKDSSGWKTGEERREIERKTATDVALAESAKIGEVAVQQVRSIPQVQPSTLIMSGQQTQPIVITRELLLKEFPAYDGEIPPKPPMLIEGFMPKGVTFIGSLSGVGKTWTGLSISKALTTGVPLWGTFEVPEKIAVLYLIPEASDFSFKYRMGKLGIIQDPTSFRYRTISQGATQPLRSPLVTAVVNELRDSGHRQVLVIVDTAIRFLQAKDENSSTQNSLTLDSDYLRSLGADVLFMHHSPKASKDAPELTLENVLRGTGDFGAMADAVYGLRRDEALYAQGEGPEEIEAANVKPRDFKPPLPFRLALSRKPVKAEGDRPVSIIDETHDLLYISNAGVKDAVGNRLEALLKANPSVSVAELKRTFKKGWDVINALATSRGWRQEKMPVFLGGKPVMTARGNQKMEKRWTNSLLSLRVVSDQPNTVVLETTENTPEVVVN